MKGQHKSKGVNHSAQDHTFAWSSRGSWWSTVQPTETQVPKISLTVPDSFRAQLRLRITRAISVISSSVRLPLCLMFFSCSTVALDKRDPPS